MVTTSKLLKKKTLKIRFEAMNGVELLTLTTKIKIRGSKVLTPY